jgi:periplasmic divalent cation tolerance protein
MAEAEVLAEQLVDQRLAACVQILPKMTSVYRWEGKIEKDEEQLLMIKTSDEKFAEVEKFLLENHPYETPEIVAINAEHVSEGYLTWLTKSVSAS